MSKKYTLTDEHREQLKPWANKWIANAMSTKAMDDNDREQMRIAVRGLYKAANLEPPPDHRIVFVASPFILRFAGGFAAAIWHLRKTKRQDVADATNAATAAATHEATRAATRAATHAATRDATYDATYAATADATYYATDAATDDATDAATDDATYDASLAATDSATAAATRDATRDATDAATAATPRSKRWFSFSLEAMTKLSHALKLGKFGLACASDAYRMWQGGNQWSAWVSFLSFFRHVAQLKIDYSKWEHWERAAIHGGPRIMHEKFCMISDRPEVLMVDDKNRPHCETGPFCRWRDGSGLYAIHGVRVPQWLVETPASEIDINLFKELDNAEVKRIFIKKVGIKRLLEVFKAKKIHKKTITIAGKNHPYELLEFSPEKGWDQRWLRMLNPSTGEIHVERVPRDCETVEEALSFRNFGDRKIKFIKPEVLT